MAKKENFVQFCPICGSKEFGFYIDDPVTEVAGTETYKCKRCKNIFSFPLELPKSEAKRIKEVPLTAKIMRDTPKSATIPVGNVEIGVYWKILGVLMFIFGLGYIIMALIPVNCYTMNSITTCDSTIFPANYAFVGLAVLAAGMYFILESHLLTHHYNQSRLMKIGLVLAILIIMLFFWAGSVTIYVIP